MPYILQNPEIRISVIAQKGFPLLQQREGEQEQVGYYRVELHRHLRRREDHRRVEVSLAFLFSVSRGSVKMAQKNIEKLNRFHTNGPTVMPR